MDSTDITAKRTLLTDTSLEIIKAHQHAGGAFVASPSFSQYGYSWLRDNTYNAYALLLYGQEEGTMRYLNWVSKTILKHRHIIEQLPGKLETGRQLANSDFLGARYTVDGGNDESDWPNFQIDGYGSWLWLLSRYLEKVQLQEIPGKWLESVNLVLQYLSIVWSIPNSDCWEEHPDHIHPSTLACVAGGVKAISCYLDPFSRTAAETLAGTIRSFIIQHSHPSGRFPKYIGSESIDASLIWLSTPYKVFPADHPLMRNTVKAIERQILEEGGVKRYPEDTYYGGGQWIILSAWLAWYYLEEGSPEKARPLLDWIIRQQKDDGTLPEQVLARTNDPSMIRPWEERWGPVAAPLLWSHAMYLIVDYQLSGYYTIQKEKNHA